MIRKNVTSSYYQESLVSFILFLFSSNKVYIMIIKLLSNSRISPAVNESLILSYLTVSISKNNKKDLTL